MTATGSALDPITDKLFVLTVTITLVVAGSLSLVDLLLLSTRELGELPLMFWLVSSPAARWAWGACVEQPAANFVGKAATSLQFAAVSGVLFHATEASPLVDAAAVASITAAFTYWRRAVCTPPGTLQRCDAGHRS